MTGFDGDTVSPLRAGLSCACPRCGRGRLFAGFLDVAGRCDVCGLDLGQQNSGDGPAFFIIMIVGFIVVGLALVVEMSFSPPAWLHLVLWLPLCLVLSVALLRPFKGVMIALQYRHRVQFDRDHDPD